MSQPLSETDVRRLLATFERDGSLDDPRSFYTTMIAWPRRMTFDEAMEFGQSLPQSLLLDPFTGRPRLSRAEWEQLPRSHRIRDVLLLRDPRKERRRRLPRLSRRSD
jgi:hypothetical protein